ncbi:MAG: EAL domain-containing protein [Clostridia bacterium]|nr:EAL domain-containing protein [Clostridia bacterium]
MHEKAFESDIKFEELIDFDCLLNMLEAFENLTHCTMTIVDMHGNHIIDGEKACALCRLVKKTQKGGKKCAVSDERLIEDVKKSGKMIARPCESAGLTDVALPIIVKGVYVGTIFAGQINAHNLTEDAVRRYAAEIGASESEMADAYRRVPKADNDYFKKTIALLEVFIQQLSKMMAANLEIKQQLDINSKNTEIIQKAYDLQLLFNNVLQALFVDTSDGDSLKNAAEHIKKHFDLDTICIFEKFERVKNSYVVKACSEFQGEHKDMTIPMEFVSKNIDTLIKNGFLYYEADGHDNMLKSIGDKIRSITVFPIYMDKVFSGFMGMCSERKQSFGDAQISALKSISYVIGSYMAKIEADKRVEQMAFCDPLLGIPNRLACERRLDEVLEKAKKTGQSGAVLFVDLDNFKEVNDAYGHSYGDLLLTQIVSFFDGTDLVRGNYYRFGGDEFIIILDGLNSDEAGVVVSCILDRFRQPWKLNGIEHGCTISIGMSLYPEHGTTADEIVRNADVAMYRAKMHGKDSMAIFNLSVDEAFLKNRELESELVEMVSSGDFSEFDIYYQPIIDVKTGKVFAEEALIRWESPKFGKIEPERLVALAENTEIINSLNLWVLEKACEKCAVRQKTGKNLSICVNFTLRQLQNARMVEKVLETLKKASLSPKHLYIELQEAASLERMTSAISNIGRLRRAGVKIVMDDFGSGVSSLSNLRQIPLDMLKTDRSLISRIDDKYIRTIIRSLSDIAHSMDLKICIKGVENDVQAEFARGVGSDYVQGFAFGVPAKDD